MGCGFRSLFIIANSFSTNDLIVIKTVLAKFAMISGIGLFWPQTKTKFGFHFLEALSIEHTNNYPSNFQDDHLIWPDCSDKNFSRG
jgi:hypothetical protein